MKKILFVCTGNTCRSPMATAIFHQLINDHRYGGNGSAEGISAGLYAAEGAPMTDAAIAALREVQIPVPQVHSAKQLTPEMLEEADLILTMERRHLVDLLEKHPSCAKKAHVLKAYAFGTDGMPAENARQDIPDPYGHSAEMYRQVAIALYGVIRMLVFRMAADAKNA